MVLASLVLIIAAPAALASPLQRRLNNGVGVTPAMGWNNWNSGLSSSAANALAAANAFVSLGLDKLGYQYVNMDDAWSSSSRDSSGNLVADPNKFPNGVKVVADQIHALGLKFGLYGDSGTATCSGFPGSQGYETKDAAQLASWGVDYWKYDNCNTPSGYSQPRYNTMRDALAATGRPILYSLCQWGIDAVYTWGNQTGNSWRVGGDITNSWSSVASIAANNAPIASYAGPGGFNDFDMMEIGNGQLTAAEERAHFGLWAISKSPLLLGCDLTKISATSLATIKNAGVIAINQDALGKAASLFQPAGAAAPQGNALYPYWAGPLSGGDWVIGLVAANGAATLSASFADVPGLGAGTYSWTELYTGATGSGTGVSATLTSHDMAIFRVKGNGKPGTTTTKTTTTSSKAVTITASTTRRVTTTPVTTTRLTTTSSKTTTTSSKIPTTTTKAITTTTQSSSTGVASQWQQCGGIGYTGPTQCASPFTCTVQNPYYSQCL
ncbi:Alpha-galactosidase [Arthrobotrys entomopaga]|nr:Alpha-galactosidase [Arthrobotrys entomopaga]